MPLKTIQIRPGFNTQLSPTANESGWSNGNLVRWKNGLLEKVGGWQRLFNSTTNGVVRSLHAWEDLTNTQDLLIATDFGDPQVYANGSLTGLQFAAGIIGQQDIIQYIATSGSTTLTVNSGNIVFQAFTGASVDLLLTEALGGFLVPAGANFTVGQVLTPGTFGGASFTINLHTASTISTTYNGGIVFFLSSTFTPPFIRVEIDQNGLATGALVSIGDFATNITIVPNNSFPSEQGIVSIPMGAVATVNSILDANHFLIDGTPWLSSPFNVQSSFGYGFTEGSVSDGAGNIVIFNTPIIVSLTNGPSPPPQNWATDNLGNTGLVSFTNGAIYSFTPPVTSGAVLQNAGLASTPQQNAGMFVAMPQAQVITFGTQPVLGTSGIDPLLIRFSDAGSFTSWTASVTNQAGSYRLSRGSLIVGAIQAPQTTLIWTDTDVWSMSYIGPPLVYGFTILGAGCGLVALYARATLGRTTYWQAQNSFWTFGDSGVQPLSCPVWDAIFANLNTVSIARCFAGANSSFHEVWFFFPSLSGNPCWNVTTMTSNCTASNFNTTLTSTSTSSSVGSSVFSSTSRSSGLWYTEGVFTGNATDGKNTAFGIGKSGVTSASGLGADANGWAIAEGGTVLRHNGNTAIALTKTPAIGDIIQVAWDAGTGNLFFGINNVWQNSGNPVTEANPSFTGVTGTLFIMGSVGGDGTHAGSLAFNQPFTFTPPAGYSAWTGAGECDSYVKFNAAENLWDFGSLQRTAWLDNNVFGPPLGGDSNNRIQQHEIGYDNDGTAMSGVFAETGYSQVAAGEQMMFFDQMIPDFKWFGNLGTASVNLTLKYISYPGDAQQSDGPFAISPTTEWLPLRRRAREVAMHLDWAATSGFTSRVEAIRFRVAPSGRQP